MQFELKHPEKKRGCTVAFTYKNICFQADYPLNQTDIQTWRDLAEGLPVSSALSDCLSVESTDGIVTFNLGGSTCSGCECEVTITLPFEECQQALLEAADALEFIDLVDDD